MENNELNINKVEENNVIENVEDTIKLDMPKKKNNNNGSIMAVVILLVALVILAAGYIYYRSLNGTTSVDKVYKADEVEKQNLGDYYILTYDNIDLAYKNLKNKGYKDYTVNNTLTPYYHDRTQKYKGIEINFVKLLSSDGKELETKVLYDGEEKKLFYLYPDTDEKVYINVNNVREYLFFDYEDDNGKLVILTEEGQVYFYKLSEPKTAADLKENGTEAVLIETENLYSSISFYDYGVVTDEYFTNIIVGESKGELYTILGYSISNLEKNENEYYKVIEKKFENDILDYAYVNRSTYYNDEFPNYIIKRNGQIELIKSATERVTLDKVKVKNLLILADILGLDTYVDTLRTYFIGMNDELYCLYSDTEMQSLSTMKVEKVLKKDQDENTAIIAVLLENGGVVFIRANKVLLNTSGLIK